MTKPNDIPQDVWDQALHLWRDDEADPGEVIIARAIMAAKEEERAECARIAFLCAGGKVSNAIRNRKLANNTNKD